MRQGIRFGWLLFPVVALASVSAGAAGTVTPLVSFNPAIGELPESVTMDDDGNFYLSMSNTIKKVTPSLEVSVYATLPIPAGAFATGVKFGPDGLLYAGSGGFGPSPSAAFVWRIHPDGAVDQLAALDPNGFPNDLAFDDDGNLFVTDPFLGEIWKIDGEGNASVWASDPILLGNAANPALLIHDFGVDGIAFDKKKKNLYVNNLDYGEIVRIGVEDGCEAGEPEVFASDPLLVGSDGIAFDHKGTLYVAVNGQDRLAAVSPEGDVTSLAVGAPLDGPSSLVFGTHGNDKKTLYVASFAISRALGTAPGAPHPGISSIQVPAGGLSLP